MTLKEMKAEVKRLEGEKKTLKKAKGNTISRSDRPEAPETCSIALVRDTGDPSWTSRDGGPAPEFSELYFLDEQGKLFPKGVRLADSDSMGLELVKELKKCAKINKSTGRRISIKFSPDKGCWSGRTELYPKYMLDQFTTTHEALGLG